MLRGLLLIMCIGFAALFAIAVTQRDEMYHRAERAEARADSLAMVVREHTVPGWWQIGPSVVVVRPDSATVDSLEREVLRAQDRERTALSMLIGMADLADSLRDSRNYWWAVAHAKDVRR